MTVRRKHMRYSIMEQNGKPIPWSQGVPTTSIAHLRLDPDCWTVKDHKTGVTAKLGKKCVTLGAAGRRQSTTGIQRMIDARRAKMRALTDRIGDEFSNRVVKRVEREVTKLDKQIIALEKQLTARAKRKR